jgi:hypothetical protein
MGYGFSSGGGKTRARDDIAYLWARWNETGEGSSSRSKGSVSFERERFISYATPVARYYEIDRQKFVLITTFKHSVTTSSHIGAAVEAVNVPVFDVEKIGMGYGNLTMLDHLDNARDLYARLEKEIERTKRWRGGWDNTSYLLENIERLWDQCQHYVNLTGVKFQLRPRREMIDEAAAGRALAKARWYEGAPKRERAAAKKLAMQVLTQ